MNYETYQLLLYGMSSLAVVVFVSLYFVKAGYGMFRTRSWGWSVPNKVGWVCMEAPAFLVMGIGAWKGEVSLYTPQAVFVGLFLLHYFQRSFVFPLLMKGEESDAIGYHGGGNTFQCNQWDVAFSQFFQLCTAGKV